MSDNYDPREPQDAAGPPGETIHTVPSTVPHTHHAEGQWPKPLPDWRDQIAEVEAAPGYYEVQPDAVSRGVKKAKVVATSTVTILSGLAVFLTLASPEIAQLFPDSAEDIARWSTVIVGWLGTAIAALRRVTPVPGRLHGILPDPKVKVPS